MKRITIKPNPFRQKRDEKIIEIAFTDSSGKYRGCLISFRFANDIPIINLYCIDEGINIYVTDKKEKPL